MPLDLNREVNYIQWPFSQQGCFIYSSCFPIRVCDMAGFVFCVHFLSKSLWKCCMMLQFMSSKDIK